MTVNHANDSAFIPMLNVLAEYGNAPFLWVVTRPDQGGVGPNLCDGTGWDESMPMSEGLWRKFADWAMAFDHMAFYQEDCDVDDWDWLAFHARGLHLCRWLKEEVGDAYRVVYNKPPEDPNRRIDERMEILRDGRWVSVPSFRDLHSASRFCAHIVSGGQTGADRGALDFAMAHGYTHGGWAPSGRLAEDGPIPLKYQLREMPGGYRARTRQNVVDSDATLIVNLGELDGGTRMTADFAAQQGKPCWVVQADAGLVGLADDVLIGVIAWLRGHGVKTLNVAGPREGKRPGIARMTQAVLAAMHQKHRGECLILR